jgi:hypothetical protein
MIEFCIGCADASSMMSDHHGARLAALAMHVLASFVVLDACSYARGGLLFVNDAHS